MEESEKLEKSVLPQVHKKSIVLAPLVPLVALVLLIITKSPGEGGPMVILLFLFLVFLLSLSISANLFILISKVLKKKQLSTLRLLYSSVAVAAGVVFAVGLQTLGQLQLIDLILVLVFEFLVNFYLLRRF